MTTQENSSLVSMSSDSWTSDVQDPYSSSKGHYINKNWELVSRLLSFGELPGSHTGEVHGADWYAIMKKYGIRDKASFVFALLAVFSQLCAPGPLYHVRQPSNQRQSYAGS
jgi:hypothetical protein